MEAYSDASISQLLDFYGASVTEKQQGRNETMAEIRLTTNGLPPAKNTAISIFNPSHPHHPRVIALLHGVKEALDSSSWNPTERRHIGLELVITETPNGMPGDATNYLGGVADVLQANRVNADLSHLGDMGRASLYVDDNQIREVHFSVEQGVTPGYRVRVWAL